MPIEVVARAHGRSPLSLVEGGIIYRNPLPMVRSVHAYTPFVQQLSPNEHLAVYRIGSAFQSPDGVLWVSRSHDRGRTWLQEGQVWDPRHDTHPWNYIGPHLTRLRDGRLLLAAARFDAAYPDAPCWNPETEGYRELQPILFRSADGGRTWSPPEVVSLPPEFPVGHNTGAVIEMADGRWLYPFETWKAWDDPSPVQHRTGVLTSLDQGRTWGDPIVITDGSADRVVYWDSRIVVLDGNRLYASSWTRHADTVEDLPIHQVFSSDGGRTWTKPTSSAIVGQTNSNVYLGNDRLVKLYNRRRSDRPGIAAIMSTDGGRTWDPSTEILVWDAFGSGRIGADDPDQNTVADMLRFAFGRPMITVAPDGDLIAAFWCTEACVTHARWARLRVEA